MKMKCITSAAVVLMLLQATLSAAEANNAAPKSTKSKEPAATPLNAPVKEISLFKNGMAFVKRGSSISRSGLYELAETPKPVHGTFWINSPSTVSVISGKREVPYTEELAAKYGQSTSGMMVRRPNYPQNDMYMKALEGRSVGITYSNAEGKTGIVNGVVMPSDGGHLLLKTQRGYLFINRSSINMIETAEINPESQAMLKVPFMQLDVHMAENPDKKPVPLDINYLTHGLCWAPAYRIDLSEPLGMKIEQQATIRNELEDMQDVRVRLITGFPNIALQNVTALISPEMNLANFFNQLNGHHRGPYRNSNFDQQILFNAVQSVNNNDNDYSPVMPTLEHVKTGELYFRDLGMLNLKKDQSFCKSLDKEKAPYENIVEWNIGANRDEWGRMRNQFNGNQERQKQDDIWDGVRFKNPFSYPMTTAPVTFIQNGQFIGEGQSSFVAPGEETIIRINKALSIRVKNNEYEDKDNQNYRSNKDNPNRFYKYGSWYEKRKAHGEMTIRNFRNTQVKVLIKKQLVGKLLQSSPEGKSQLLADGISNVNPQNLIRWEILVKPGEEITVKYSYEVIVRV